MIQADPHKKKKEGKDEKTKVYTAIVSDYFI